MNKPILLKRGLSATINEFLLSAEYIIAHGNREVILCERGIRTFETMTRNTLDINAIALIKELSHLPIIIDASHGTGKRSLVEPVTLAGIFAGEGPIIVMIGSIAFLKTCFRTTLFFVHPFAFAVII